MLLDLLTNILDLGNITLVRKNAIATEQTKKNALSQHYLQLLWNSRIRKTEFERLHCNLVQVFKPQTLSKLESNQLFVSKLVQGKQSEEAWRFKSEKVLQNIPQLYLDYGYGVGGCFEGFALVQPLGNGDFELGFPVAHQKEKKLCISLYHPQRDFECIQKCEFEFSTKKTIISTQNTTILSMEAFRMLHSSAQDLNLDIFACQGEQFSCFLPAEGEMVILTAKVEECLEGSLFSRVELYTFQHVLQAFLSKTPRKE